MAESERNRDRDRDRDSVVYALHAFVAENPDELTFSASDEIQVLERDDLYNDGWWNGLCLRTNQVGLFPFSYTSPVPTAASAIMHQTIGDVQNAINLTVQGAGEEEEGSFVEVDAEEGNASLVEEGNRATLAEKAAQQNDRYSALQKRRESQGPLLVLDEIIPMSDEDESSADEADSAHSPTHHQRQNSPHHHAQHTRRQSSLGSLNLLPSAAANLSVPAARVLSDQGGRPGANLTISTGSLMLPLAVDKFGPVNQWSEAVVADWLRWKGFDESIVNKFKDEEIAGDVLFSLDNITLKDDLGITAFGKRAKVLAAIRELDANASPNKQDSVNSSTINTPLTASPWPSSENSMAQTTSQPQYSPGLGPMSAGGAGSGSGTAGRNSPFGGLQHPDQERDLDLRRASADALLRNKLAGAPTPSYDMTRSEPKSPAQVTGYNKQINPSANPHRLSGGRHQRTGSSTYPVQEEIEGDLERSDTATSNTAVSHDTLPSNKSGSKKESLTPTTEKHGFFAHGPFHRSRKSLPTNTEESSSEKSGIGRLMGRGNSKSRNVSTESKLQSPSSPRHKEISDAAYGNKRISVASGAPSATGSNSYDISKSGSARDIYSIIGTPDHTGQLKKKGERYPTWKERHFVLKGGNLYYFRSASDTSRAKGQIKLTGYAISTEDVSGRYGFKITRNNDKTHYFSGESYSEVREWMQALKKATIKRDLSAPVISSSNIPTIPLAEAQAMFPPPRPPSPASRTQRPTARNPELSERDARKLMDGNSLMGVGATTITPISQKAKRTSGGSSTAGADSLKGQGSKFGGKTVASKTEPEVQSDERELLSWVNNHLPATLEPVTSFAQSFKSGEVLLQLAESVLQVNSTLQDDDFHPTYEGTPNEVTLREVLNFMTAQGIPVAAQPRDISSGDVFLTKQIVEALRRKEINKR